MTGRAATGSKRPEQALRPGRQRVPVVQSKLRHGGATAPQPSTSLSLVGPLKGTALGVGATLG
jgi:hypothetical protein